MKYSFLRVICPSLVLAVVLGYIGCTAGTNTGNGTAAGTGGASGFCTYMPCLYSANATGPEGTTYRGRISAITVAKDSYAQSLPNPPVAELLFVGSEVDLSDAGCQVVESGVIDQVRIFISTADSSIDASGTLHVRSAGRNDSYAAGPGDTYNPPNPGWAVDLTLTVDGKLTATLSLASADPSDAGAAVQELKINGPLDPSCVPGPDGGVIPASISVSGGGTFSFPCWQRKGCFDWSDPAQ